jgi:galactokinase
MTLRTDVNVAEYVGAGWGGCTVSLVSESDASSFIKKLKDGYKPYQELTEKEFEDVVFATKPGSGAAGKWFRTRRSDVEVSLSELT